jgi:replicative DNA helicase
MTLTPYTRKRDETPACEDVLATLNQPLPHSEEAEKGVLSCLLQDPKRCRPCRVAIQPESFYREDTRTIYTELLTMEEEGVPFDLVLFTQRMRDRGLIERVGGVGGVTEIFTFVPIPAHFQYYLTIIRDKWRLRRGIHGRALAIAHLFKHGGEMVEETPEQMISTCQQIVQTFDESTTSRASTTATLDECLMEHMDHMQALTERLDAGGEALIPTGFPTVDRNCGGIGLGEYWLITGPTKSGKSVLAGCMARHAARRGFKTKIFTNEVDRRTYSGRLLVGENPMLSGKIDRTGFEDRKQQDEYAKAVHSLRRSIGKTVSIDNAAGKYVEDVVADIRYEAERGLQLVVVDLIGKLRTRQRFGTREQELAYISLCLHDAKIFGAAIIVLAQENEDGQVRESKSLSFDCDAWLKITHVYPDAKKKMFGAGDEKKQPVRDRRNLVVELARGFASGDVIPCFFNGPNFAISELSREPQP